MRRVVVFALWTFFVWGTRLRIAWLHSKEATGIRLYSSAWAVVLIVLAAAALVAGIRARGGPRVARPVFVLLVLTIAAWATSVHGVIHHGGVAFMAVHLSLAVISAVLGGWAFAGVPASARRKQLALTS